MKVINVSNAVRTSTKPLRRSLLAATGLALSLLTGGTAVADKAPAPLKFKWGAPTADYYPLYVAIDLKLFEKHGLAPEFFWFPTGAPLLAGLKSGDIDVVTTGLATVFALGQNIPLKFIGWETNTAAGAGLVVDPKSGIGDYRDLGKAKAIAAAPGTCAQTALALAARKAGVPYDSLKVVNIPPPLYANAFRSSSIDAGLTWGPYAQTLTEQGLKLANWDEDFAPGGGVCPSLVGGRSEFFAKHPEVPAKLVEIRAEALAAIERDPQLAINALVDRLAISEQAAKVLFERTWGKNMPRFEQELSADSPYSLVAERGGLAAKLHLAGELLHEAGTLGAPLSWERINASIDPSYIRAYVERRNQAQAGADKAKADRS